MKTSINMKKTKNLLSLLLAICFSSWGFSAVNPKTGSQLADSISEVRAYKAILLNKGEPVCVANATSSLTPSFLSAGSGPIETAEEELDGPQCNTEDMDRIYSIAQNSILVDDPEKGVEVAGVFFPYVALCAFTAVTGGLLATLGHGTQPEKPELVSIGTGLVGGLWGQASIYLSALVIDDAKPQKIKLFKKVDLSKVGELAKISYWKGIPVAVTCGMAGGFSVQYLLSDEQ